MAEENLVELSPEEAARLASVENSADALSALKMCIRDSICGEGLFHVGWKWGRKNGLRFRRGAD